MGIVACEIFPIFMKYKRTKHFMKTNKQTNKRLN
ncbi:hypothetical protein CLV00_1161 [Flavobacterium sp. 11]|nr:hypothetical protein CLV00_1161 [Flavobacterium sp. 11]